MASLGTTPVLSLKKKLRIRTSKDFIKFKVSVDMFFISSDPRLSDVTRRLLQQFSPWALAAHFGGVAVVHRCEPHEELYRVSEINEKKS